VILILTNQNDATADYLVERLSKASVPYLRLDTDTLTVRSEVAYLDGVIALRLDSNWYEPNEFSHVWFRRPEKLSDPRFDNLPEGKYILTEWAEALDGYFSHISQDRWINHPVSNATASHKLQQLSCASDLGFLIPDTLVTQNEKRLRDFFARHSGQVIVKPISSGHIDRLDPSKKSLVYTNVVCPTELESLDDLSNCPTLFQQFIQKRSDIRITVIDGQIHPIEIIAKETDGRQRCDIRRNSMNDVTYSSINLPIDVEVKIKHLMRAYRLRFAAIDMALTDSGEWYFLEINPNGQWAWLDLCGALGKR
jgi:Prokaryotic glutathione synthetase, ATP-grasp domain